MVELVHDHHWSSHVLTCMILLPPMCHVGKVGDGAPLLGCSRSRAPAHPTTGGKGRSGPDGPLEP
eukprot:3581721-Pyramimonas_sp.AAC.1